MESREQAIERLRQAVERTAGCQMRTNKDFDSLSEHVYATTHAKISTTTLKRIWGYLSENVNPRTYTLDQLCQYVGYDDFEAFCRQADNEQFTGGESSEVATPAPADNTEPAEDTVPAPADSTEPTREKPTRPRRRRRTIVAVAAVAVVLLLLAALLPMLLSRGAVKAVIVSKGQHFESYESYLRLFGLEGDTGVPYFVRIPEKPYIVLWAPEYHNPVWHNEGDSAAMMPTITERFHPENWPTDSASLAELAQKQKEGFITAFRQNQVRLCFMKNLVDSGFVFLGVYCLSASLSDTTQWVWTRRADEVTDIESLDLLRP